jgi:hypothetical protein
MNTKTSIEQSHLEHRLWANELEFYREEIAIFQRHLAEIMQKNTNEKAISKANFYKNQFMRHWDVIDQLEYRLRKAEKNLAIYIKSHSNEDLGNVHVDDQDEMRSRIDSFKRTYQQLKEGFMRYESEWM